MAASCTKPLTIDFNNTEEQIVVNSIFSIDSLFNINLTKSARLNEGIFSKDDFKVIDDAQVLIYNKNTIIDTAVSIKNGNYSGHIHPLENHQYKIVIKTDNYNDVYAETIAPSIVLIDTLIMTEIRKNEEYEIKIIFTDKPDEDNFYCIYMFGESYYYETENLSIGEWKITDNRVPVFNDKLFSGNQYEVKFNVLVSLVNEDSYTNKIAVFLYSFNEEYYSFLKSYNKQVSFGDDDDLQEYFMQGLIEPIPIYSNIKGGQGFFSIYSMSVDTVYFEHLKN
jgi:hypothetical protein